MTEDALQRGIGEAIRYMEHWMIHHNPSGGYHLTNNNFPDGFQYEMDVDSLDKVASTHGRLMKEGREATNTEYRRMSKDLRVNLKELEQGLAVPWKSPLKPEIERAIAKAGWQIKPAGTSFILQKKGVGQLYFAAGKFGLKELRDAGSHALSRSRNPDRLAFELMSLEQSIKEVKPMQSAIEKIRELQPVNKGLAINYVTGKPYMGVNSFALEPGSYATYNQWKKAGFTVNHGEKASYAFFTEFKNNELSASAYPVFSADQVHSAIKQVEQASPGQKNLEEIAINSVENYLQDRNLTIPPQHNFYDLFHQMAEIELDSAGKEEMSPEQREITLDLMADQAMRRFGLEREPASFPKMDQETLVRSTGRAAGFAAKLAGDLDLRQVPEDQAMSKSELQTRNEPRADHPLDEFRLERQEVWREREIRNAQNLDFLPSGYVHENGEILPSDNPEKLQQEARIREDFLVKNVTSLQRAGYVMNPQVQDALIQQGWQVQRSGPAEINLSKGNLSLSLNGAQLNENSIRQYGVETSQRLSLFNGADRNEVMREYEAAARTVGRMQERYGDVSLISEKSVVDYLEQNNPVKEQNAVNLNNRVVSLTNIEMEL